MSKMFSFILYSAGLLPHLTPVQGLPTSHMHTSLTPDPTLRMMSSAFHMPAETGPHAGTIMAWPTKRSILDTEWSYGGADVNETRKELAAIARTIAKYEPLHLFALDPAAEDESIKGPYGSSLDTAKSLLGDAKGVTIHNTSDVDCLWARDTGPIFVYQTDGTPVRTDWSDDKMNLDLATASSVGLVLSFNQWGGKNLPTPDSYFAPTAASILSHQAMLAPFVAEGGAIEVDGDGTLIATESSILNPNRNPGIDKVTMELYFQYMFGVTKMIWLKGTRDEDVTDDHIDALVRFAAPGVVFLSRPYVDDSWNEQDKADALKDYNSTRTVLSDTTDAKGRSLRVVDVQEPDPSILGVSRETLEESGASVAYVNYHVVNNAVIVPGFGDVQADAEAVKVIGREFPGRVVEQVLCKQLAIQGGGIHCATQQILA